MFETVHFIEIMNFLNQTSPKRFKEVFEDRTYTYCEQKCDIYLPMTENVSYYVRINNKTR